MEISIVIPTKNRAEMLRVLLCNIAAQPFSKDQYEVIVIDNGSTDHTRNVCAEIRKNELPNMRYIYDARPGLHVGRNRGLLESRADIVAYLDDDELPFPHWIETIAEGFRDQNTMAVCGSLIPYDMSVLPDSVISNRQFRANYVYLWSVSCFWERDLSEQDTRSHRMDPAFLFGGNCAFRKEVLLECGGFHPDSMPGNLLMYRGDGENHVGKYLTKNHKKCMYYAQASIYHVLNAERLTPEYLRHMDFRNGISKAYTLLREENIGKAVWELLSDIYSSLADKRWQKNSSYIGGKCYLILYYVFYRRVRDWVHKKDYF